MFNVDGCNEYLVAAAAAAAAGTAMLLCTTCALWRHTLEADSDTVSLIPCLI